MIDANSPLADIMKSAAAQGILVPAFNVAYLPMLAAMRHPLASSLTLETIRALRELFPEDARRLAVLHANVAWRARIEPVG